MSFIYHKQKFGDSVIDRNKKMITILERKSVVGSFLFFLYGKVGEQAPGFITPPGLTDEEAELLCKEFFALFGKFAKRAMERKEKEHA